MHDDQDIQLPGSDCERANTQQLVKKIGPEVDEDEQVNIAQVMEPSSPVQTDARRVRENPSIVSTAYFD